MTSTIAPAGRETLVAAPPRARTDRAIFGRTFRQIRTGALVVAIGFGLSAAATALSYVATFPTEAARQEAAAAVGTDVGMAILLGPIASIDTVGGYLVYKNFVFLTTIGAIWALLAATKVLRGNEEAGRWQLLLAGSTRPARATAVTMGALAAAVGVVFVGVTLCTVLAARDPELELSLWSCVVYGASLALIPAVFAAVGALTSQVSRSRRQASGIGLVVVALAFVLRMIADTGPGARWVAWLTPFGWTELVAPFTQDRLTPIGVGLVVAIGLGAAAAWIAARRDVGAGLIDSNDRSEIRRFGLGSPLGLSVRLERGTVIAWWIGALVLGLTFGFFASVTTSSLPESIRDPLQNFGVSGAIVDQFLGVVFLIVAATVALVPAGQLGAAADEELSGRLIHVVTGPNRRTSWFVGRLVIAAVAVAVAAVLTAAGIWIGGRSRGVDLELVSVLGAGLNVIPTALVVLAIGAVALAIAPRTAATTVYVVVSWSLFVDLVGALVPSLSWLGRTSIFDTMALAPGETPVASTLALTMLVALALGAVATAVFARRDLRV